MENKYLNIALGGANRIANIMSEAANKGVKTLNGLAESINIAYNALPSQKKFFELVDKEPILMHGSIYGKSFFDTIFPYIIRKHNIIKLANNSKKAKELADFMEFIYGKLIMAEMEADLFGQSNPFTLDKENLKY